MITPLDLWIKFSTDQVLYTFHLYSKCEEHWITLSRIHHLDLLPQARLSEIAVAGLLLWDPAPNSTSWCLARWAICPAHEVTCFHTCPEVTKFPRFLLKPTWLNYSCCPILDKANLWDPRVLAFKWNSISVFCYRILPLKLRMVFTCFSHSDRIPHMTTPTRTSLSIIRPCHRVHIFSGVAFYQSFIRGVPSTHIRKDHYQILPPESMSNESIELHFLLSYISSSRTQFLACCYHTWGNLRLCGLSTCWLLERKAKDIHHLQPSRNHKKIPCLMVIHHLALIPLTFLRALLAQPWWVPAEGGFVITKYMTKQLEAQSHPNAHTSRPFGTDTNLKNRILNSMIMEISILWKKIFQLEVCNEYNFCIMRVVFASHYA